MIPEQQIGAPSTWRVYSEQINHSHRYIRQRATWPGTILATIYFWYSFSFFPICRRNKKHTVRRSPSLGFRIICNVPNLNCSRKTKRCPSPNPRNFYWICFKKRAFRDWESLDLYRPPGTRTLLPPELTRRQPSRHSCGEEGFDEKKEPGLLMPGLWQHPTFGSTGFISAFHKSTSSRSPRLLFSKDYWSKNCNW